MSAWWFVALGLAWIIGTVATLPFDERVIDPRTRRPRGHTRRTVIVATVGAAGLVFAAACIEFGRLLG